MSFTIAFADDGHPLDLPVTYGLVRLDGADTVPLHAVLDVGDEPLGIGRRVEAVLRPVEDRTGSILDIEGFRPRARRDVSAPDDGSAGGILERVLLGERRLGPLVCWRGGSQAVCERCGAPLPDRRPVLSVLWVPP